MSRSSFVGKWANRLFRGYGNVLSPSKSFSETALLLEEALPEAQTRARSRLLISEGSVANHPTRLQKYIRDTFDGRRSGISPEAASIYAANLKVRTQDTIIVAVEAAKMCMYLYNEAIKDQKLNGELLVEFGMIMNDILQIAVEEAGEMGKMCPHFKLLDDSLGEVLSQLSAKGVKTIKADDPRITEATRAFTARRDDIRRPPGGDKEDILEHFMRAVCECIATEVRAVDHMTKTAAMFAMLSRVVPEERFKQHVAPYFDAHLACEDGHDISAAVEVQHSDRVKNSIFPLQKILSKYGYSEERFWNYFEKVIKEYNEVHNHWEDDLAVKMEQADQNASMFVSPPDMPMVSNYFGQSNPLVAEFLTRGNDATEGRSTESERDHANSLAKGGASIICVILAGFVVNERIRAQENEAVNNHRGGSQVSPGP